MRPAAPKKQSLGFTLIELLVVLMIMGLFVGLVSAIVQPDERGLLRVEAERLAQLLDLAKTESRLSGKSIAWTSDGAGYHFYRSGDDSGGFGDARQLAPQWTEIRDNDLLRPRSLPYGMQIAGLRIENMPARAGMRLEFAPYGLSPAFAIDMSLGIARYAVTASPLGELLVMPRDAIPGANGANGG